MTAPATPTPLDEVAGWVAESDGTSLSPRAHRALATVTALVTASLAYPCRFCGAVSAYDCQRDCPQRQYRAWAPSPDAGTGDGGGE